LVEHGISPISLNATLTGLKFLFETTLNHTELLAKMHSVNVPYKLPVVLSREEVARLIAATDNLKHQTALSVAYGAGFACPRQNASKWLVISWLGSPIDPLSTRQLNRAVHAAAEAAGINKRVTMSAETQFCHTFTGTKSGCSDYSGATWSQETGDYGALRSGGDRYFA
jgi:integrase